MMRTKVLGKRAVCCIGMICIIMLWGCHQGEHNDSNGQEQGEVPEGTAAEALRIDGSGTAEGGTGRSGGDPEEKTKPELESEAGRGALDGSAQAGEVAAEDADDEDFYYVATALPRTQVEAFASKVKQQFLAHDWRALSEEIVYPITIDDVVYEDRDVFLAADFDALLNDSFFVELENESCRHMYCNWSGIMLGETGRVWLISVLNSDLTSEELRIRAINGLTKSFGLPGQVGIRAVEGSITPTSMTLLLENETDLEIVYGDDYQILQNTGGEWKPLEPIRDSLGFPDIAYLPKRGQPVTWSVDWSNFYGALEPGSYMIVKRVVNFYDSGKSDSFEQHFGFTIEAGSTEPKPASARQRRYRAS